MSASRTFAAAAALSFAFSVGRTSSGQVRIRALAEALRRAPSDVAVPRPGALSAIVELPEGEDAAAWGLPRIGNRFSVVRGSLSDLGALATLHPDWQMTWSPPLRPLLDRAGAWVGAPRFRNDTGFSGKGVVVGIVDTGIDPAHRDFRNADGSTRIAYLVNFAEDANHAGEATPSAAVLDVEDLCTRAKLACRVRTGAVIDAALKKDGGASLPTDSFGHGTHVASLAAGNGGAERKYVGIAPEATLIVARALDASGNLADANVLAATEAVFRLADEEAKIGGKPVPAVVNLSLGSDFGPHDGTSSLERSLGELVGEDHPGRAIVVAAGNSAGLFADSPNATDRLGVHTDVHVPERTRVKIPIVLRPPSSKTGDLHASVDVWLGFRPGDELEVGLERNGSEWIAPRERGFSGAYGSEKTVSVTIVNGALTSTPGELVDDAAVLINGVLPRTDQYAITLEGHGTASVWIQGEGDVSEDGGGAAMVRGATRESTVTLPAASPSVLTVGATLNRTDWVDRTGQTQRILALGGVRNPPLDSIAFFSSAGPTSDGRMKPDIVAPGAYVAGAMSRDADPRDNAGSVFSNASCVPVEDCAVVDDAHAVTVGTSMASPITAGAVALLLEQDPTLVTERIRALLEAGARRPSAPPYTLRDTAGAQGGAGVLDLVGLRDVLAGAGGGTRTPTSQSWLTLAATYAHPDPHYAVPALLLLRDDGSRAAPVDLRDVELDVEHGTITSGPESPALGVVRFTVAGSADTGGETLTVTARVRGETLATASLPIAVDVNVLREGFSARGGCGIGRSPVAPGSARDVAVLALSLASVLARRRSRH